MKKKRIGIIGFGQFGKFAYTHLSHYHKVLAYDYDLKKSKDSLEDVVKCDIIVFAVPSQSIEEICNEVAGVIDAETLIIDVTSVKVKPLKILQKYFPNNQLLGTHPIFGPQSGKGGLQDLPIVLCNISTNISTYQKIKSFLSEILDLNVIEKSAEEHDREMAYVQGMSHFIGRALKNLNIDLFETSTYSYKQLVHLRDLLKEDSWALFETIQNENPYAKEVRRKLMTELGRLEESLE